MANFPVYQIKSGGVEGCVWESKYGLQPSIKKPKKTKDGKFVKEDGKQVYTDFYNVNDLLNIEYIARRLRDYILDHQEKKDEPSNSNDEPEI